MVPQLVKLFDQTLLHDEMGQSRFSEMALCFRLNNFWVKPKPYRSGYQIGRLTLPFQGFLHLADVANNGWVGKLPLFASLWQVSIHISQYERKECLGRVGIEKRRGEFSTYYGTITVVIAKGIKLKSIVKPKLHHPE